MKLQKLIAKKKAKAKAAKAAKAAKIKAAKKAKAVQKRPNCLRVPRKH